MYRVVSELLPNLNFSSCEYCRDDRKPIVLRLERRLLASIEAQFRAMSALGLQR